jgi:hypothetical protein
MELKDSGASSNPVWLVFGGWGPSTFTLHLKECEFRFNHRNQDLYQYDPQIDSEKPAVLVMTLHHFIFWFFCYSRWCPRGDSNTRHMV